MANAYGVICISEFARSQLMYLSDPSHWAKLRVVHMGVDLDRYPLRPRRSTRFLSVSVRRPPRAGQGVGAPGRCHRRLCGVEAGTWGSDSG